MGELDVVPVSALDQEQLGPVRAIYEEAFPPALRVPFAELVHTGDLDQMFVAVAGTTPVGFAWDTAPLHRKGRHEPIKPERRPYDSEDQLDRMHSDPDCHCT